MKITAEQAQREIAAIDALENLIEYIGPDIIDSGFRAALQEMQTRVIDYRTRRISEQQIAMNEQYVHGGA